MDFRMLGPLSALDGDKPVSLGGPKQRAVLALLLVRANTAVTTDRLIDELYGDEPPPAARKSLQSYVANLRKTVNTDRELLRGEVPGYVLEVDSRRIDAREFERLAHQGRALLDDDPSRARDCLAEALALWYGAPLIDLADEAPSLRQEAVKLTELRLTAIEDRIDADLTLGRHRAVVAELESLLAEHPLRERLWGQLMLALYRSGRQAEALRGYQKARRVLGEELGIEPWPALQDLEDRILAQDPALEASATETAIVDQAPGVLGTGHTIRGYELRERIRPGRIGDVYRAFQPSMGREVAVEVVRPELAQSAAFARRFETDAGRVARLEHPHVVPVYDYWREPGGAFVVRRWMRGGSLAAAVRSGSWSPDAVARLAEQIGWALEAADRHGVGHGGVDAENVLLDEDGNAYLEGVIGGEDAAPPPDAAAGSGVDVGGLARLALAALTGDIGVADLSDPLSTSIDPAVLDVVAGGLAPGSRFPDVGAFVSELSMAAAAPRPAVAAVTNPYKGLRSFREADAADFFGREALTATLLARIGGSGPQQRFLAVVGPSGSGKSSAVYAGLVPALRSGALPGSKDWFIVDMLPGSDPWEELEAALLRIAVNPPASLLEQLAAGASGLGRAVKRVLPGPDSELVLIIDQLEELFTLVEEEDTRSQFMDAIVAAVEAPTSQVRVVVTLRADFYDRPLRHPGMSRLVTKRLETVRPLDPEELRRAIVGPAERLGVDFEPGLVAGLVADLTHEPGALPLLQYTLTELFERREEATLTLAAYEAVGGVQGALGRRAEELFVGLSAASRAAARQVLLRLVALGEGTRDARRRVTRSELAAIEGQRREVETVLEVFGAQRLLSFDRDPITRSPTVEVAHEALLREWPRLREWISDGRADLRYEKALRTATAEWQASGGDSSYLLTGERLHQFESWSETSGLVLTRGERDFLAASLEARKTAAALEAERQHRERMLEHRSRTRLRLLVGVLAVAAAIAIALALAEQSQRRQAEHNLAIAASRQLTAEAIQALDGDPELGMLLAVAAADTALEAGEDVLSETVEALHRAVLASRIVVTVPGGGGNFSPDGSRFVTADPGTMFAGGTFEGGARVYSSSGEELLAMRGHSDRTYEATFSPDGTVIATTSFDGTVRLWDPSVGTELQVLELADAELFGAAFSNDGRTLAIGSSEPAVRLIDVASGEVEAVFPVAAAVIDLAMSDTGLLALAADTAGAFVINASSGEQQHHLTGHRSGTCRVRFSPDGTRLATAAQDGTARLWDLATGNELRLFTGHAGPVCGLAFSPDGERLATAGEDGTARVWDVVSGRELVVLSGHATGIGGVVFDPSGRFLATAGGDGFTKLWDVSPGGSRELLTVAPGGPASFAAYSPDGKWLASGTDEGAVAVWDAATGDLIADLAGHTGRISGGAFSPDGTLLVTSGDDRSARVWDVAAGRERFPVEEHSDTVWGSTFNPEGTVLVTAGLDGLVALWNASDGTLIGRLEGIDAAFSAAFNPDGDLLAVVGIDLQVWDVATRTRVARIDPSPGAILAVEFSPDGMLLATAAADGSARLWDAGAVPEGVLREVAVLEGHSGAVLDVAFNPDGSSVATSALDDTVKIWDVAGNELLVLPVRMPGMLAFDPGGTRLGIPSADGSVRVYALPVDELLELARGRPTRSLSEAECDRYGVASCSGVSG